MDEQELLRVATQAGCLLLESGAETYRVEESVGRLIRAYGTMDAQVFAVPTCVIVTLEGPQGPITQLRRIYDRSTNLDKVEQVNSFCRRVCQELPPLPQVRAQLEAIQSRHTYGFGMQMVAFALVAFGFTLLFGGNLADALCAAAVGAVVRAVCRSMERFGTNGFFTKTVAGAVTAALSLVAVRMGLGSHMDKIVIGTLMNLVPGVALTNSMRDIIAGDLVAGQTRLTEALLTAVAMALGSGAALSLARLF